MGERQDDTGSLNVTVSDRTIQYLLYLIHVKGTALGKTPTGVATTLLTPLLLKLMKKDPYWPYWEHGEGSAPPELPALIERYRRKRS